MSDTIQKLKELLITRLKLKVKEEGNHRGIRHCSAQTAWGLIPLTCWS